jgi:hypothetical protein
MNNQIPLFEMPRIFFGFLFGIGPMYYVPIIGCILYGVVYGHALYKAANSDERNYSQLRTQYWIYAILRERLSNFDVAAIIYLLCLPMAPMLFLVGVISTIKH